MAVRCSRSRTNKIANISSERSWPPISPKVRDEEWNPSVAGSAARCEFFLKPLATMIELKYARKASDAKKIKTELATDFIDYGGNVLVKRIVSLVYDPGYVLPTTLATD